MTTTLKLTRHARGDYRTPDGRWQIIQPRDMDNGLQRRWLVREYVWDADPPGWFALDDDYATLREARTALADEINEEIELLTRDKVYVGIKACGCVTFALVAGVDSPRSERAELKRVLRSGRRVEVTTSEDARRRLVWDCPHGSVPADDAINGVVDQLMADA